MVWFRGQGRDSILGKFFICIVWNTCGTEEVPAGVRPSSGNATGEGCLLHCIPALEEQLAVDRDPHVVHCTRPGSSSEDLLSEGREVQEHLRGVESELDFGLWV